MGALQNLSFGFRTLRKNKSFTITAVLTLALGIGVTTAMFSIVYAVFEPMPYPKPDQLVMVWSRVRGNRNPTPAGDFIEWQRRNTSFQSIGAWTGASFNVAGDDRPEQVTGSRRTPGFFTMEGLPMLLGRDFLPEEAQPGNDHYVILSHRLWSGHFNSNRDLIGKPIRMNGEPYTVVGVLQPGNYDRFNSQLWVPLSFTPEQITHDSNFMPVMARLKDGVTMAQAQAEMDVIISQLQSEFPRTNANRNVSVEPLHLNFVTDATRRSLWLLLAAVARLFSQFLTESLILALIGGAFGVVLAGMIIDAIEAVMPPVGTMLPSEANIRISVPVLLFTIGVTTLAGLLFGAAPAWQAARVDLNEVLKLGGRSGGGGVRRKALRVLVVAEFALALTLLASGALALKGFWNLTRIDLGIVTDRVLTFRLPVPERKLEGPDQIRAYYQQMLERIKALPGVEHVAATTSIPARGTGFGVRVSVVGQPPPANPNERPGSGFQMITPEYVEALGIRVTKGRNLNEHDTATSPRVALVNEHFANRFFPGTDPIGQKFRADELIPGKPRGQQIEWQIVGVFHNVRGAGAREDHSEINVPFVQSPWPQASMVVKTSGDPKSVIRSIGAAVKSVDPDLPLAGVRTLDEIVDEALAIDRFGVVLFSCFGVLGLILSAVGIHGVMAFAVAQRTHEFGVRMALGAQRSRVINQVLKEGTILALTGSAIGLVGAYFVGRAMQLLLFGVGTIDVLAFGAVASLLIAAALLACWVPAWRASRVDPLVALRYD
jgi:hypothetical protein